MESAANVRAEKALAEAAEVDARADRSTLPVIGVPIAIKDDIPVAGKRESGLVPQVIGVDTWLAMSVNGPIATTVADGRPAALGDGGTPGASPATRAVASVATGGSRIC